MNYQFLMKMVILKSIIGNNCLLIRLFGSTYMSNKVCFSLNDKSIIKNMACDISLDP